MEAQIAPVMGMSSGDFDNDGHIDLLMGGNIYDVKPSLGGRQDASRGLMLKGDGKGNFESVNLETSGFHVEGEVRGILPYVTAKGELSMMVVKNDQPAQFFKQEINN